MKIPIKVVLAITTGIISAIALYSKNRNKNDMVNPVNEEWLDLLEAIEAAVERNYNTKRCPRAVLGPATNEEIEKVERDLGMRIPKELRKFFNEISKSTRMNWSIDEEYELSLIHI